MKSAPIHHASFNLQTFFEKFDQFADAPNAVAKMRELVLQLALNGSIIDLDSSKWESVTLGSLGEWGSGGTPLRSEPQYYGGSIPWLVIGDLNDGLVTSAATFITEEGLSNSSARMLPKGVLLIAMYGSIGKLGITGIECATNQAIAFCKPDLKRADLRYLFHTIKGIQPALLARGQGLAQKNISQTILKAWKIALPPLAEQRRIVAKVDELMALCDRLEAQQQERETQKAALARASLARFADAPTPANLERLFYPSPPCLCASVRIKENVSHRGTEAQSPASFLVSPTDLRKSILTLAVQGKLVPQDPNDEPTAKDGEDGTKASLREDSSPFGIPSLWTWKRLGDVSLIERGGSPRPIKDYLTDDPDGLNWIKIGDTEIGGRYITSTREKIRKEGLSKTRKVYPGDFLLTNSMSFGRPYITKIEGCIHDGWLRIHPPEELGPEFLYYLLSSPFVNEFFSNAAAGAVVQNLNADKVRELVIPIPPLAEQRRIVAKVEQLMALVDALETQLNASRTVGEKLLTALVAELTNGKESRSV